MIGAMAMARTSALLRREVSVGDETNRWTISPEGSVSTLSGATAWVSIIDEVILVSPASERFLLRRNLTYRHRLSSVL